MSTTVSGGTAANLPTGEAELPPLRRNYEYRALAALCGLASRRELHPRDALITLIEERVATDIRSLALACEHAEREVRLFHFETTRREPDAEDRAVLCRQLGRKP